MGAPRGTDGQAAGRFRRPAIRTLLVLALGVMALSVAAGALASGPTGAAGQTAAPPAAAPGPSPGAPNILIIVTDDQRASGTLGVMPATRRFFHAGGTRFSNAFATTPLC